MEVLEMVDGDKGTRTLLTVFPLFCFLLLVTTPMLMPLDARVNRVQ